MLLENIGDKKALNIQLSGSWFSFGINNFDLDPGQIKTITYSITPSVSSTSDTNMTHEKTIQIEGNFPTINHTFYIFVEHTNIAEGNFTGGKSLLEWIRDYCEANPNDEICGGGTKVVYVPSNDTTFNVTMSRNQLNEMMKYLFDQGDEMDVFENWVKEQISLQSEDIRITREYVNSSNQDIHEMREDIRTRNSVFIFLGIFLGFIVTGGLLFFLIRKQLQQNKLKMRDKW
jgi:hypothetical protein